jgi:integrase
VPLDPAAHHGGRPHRAADRLQPGPRRGGAKPRINPERIFGHERRRTLTPEEFGRFLAACRPFYRDHFIAQVGTGLRSGELLGLRRRRVDPDLAHVDLRGPHNLRHTFATWLEDASIPSRVIDELMGHAGVRRSGGSPMGRIYRETTSAMLARVTAAIDERIVYACKVAADLLCEAR